VKIGSKTATESVPAVPVGQGIIAFEKMPFGLVVLFGFPANSATGEPWHDDAPRKIIQVEGLSVSGFEDRANSELAHADLMRFKRFCELLHDWNRSAAASRLRLVR